MRILLLNPEAPKSHTASPWTIELHNPRTACSAIALMAVMLGAFGLAFAGAFATPVLPPKVHESLALLPRCIGPVEVPLLAAAPADER
jgi:hypothetical protein